jgi:hypothetical protein
MKTTISNKVGVASVLAAICVLLVAVPAVAQEEAEPQKVALKGEFVRVGYNDEGWVVIGYRAANESVGKEWLLLDVGITLIEGVKNQQLTPDELSVIAPDGSVIPLASQQEYAAAAGSLAGLEQKANRMGDSINYFPPGTNQPCRIGFFTSTAQPNRGQAWETVELSWQRACVGRVYFRVPGGIQYGRYFLDVQFDGSAVQAPFLIMTKEELKEIKKEVKKLEKEAKKKAKQGG